MVQASAEKFCISHISYSSMVDQNTLCMCIGKNFLEKSNLTKQIPCRYHIIIIFISHVRIVF